MRDPALPNRNYLIRYACAEVGAEKFVIPTVVNAAVQETQQPDVVTLLVQLTSCLVSHCGAEAFS